MNNPKRIYRVLLQESERLARDYVKASTEYAATVARAAEFKRLQTDELDSGLGMNIPRASDSDREAVAKRRDTMNEFNEAVSWFVLSYMEEHDED